jgi:uncharacterized protein YkwD
MARIGIASATAALALALGFAAPSLAHTHTKAHCSSAAPHRGTRSYRQSHCPKGHAPHHKGKPSHALFFTAHNGHCPDARMRPSATNAAQIRAATLCLVNRERAAHGEHALHWNADLLSAAQAHTQSMVVNGYFAHIGRSGDTSLQRIRHSGYIYSRHLGFEVAENIGWGSLWLGSPRAIVAAWMVSPGHRANILDGRLRDTGIGVSPHLGSLAPGQSGGIYTQDFGVLIG